MDYLFWHFLILFDSPIFSAQCLFLAVFSYNCVQSNNLTLSYEYTLYIVYCWFLILVIFMMFVVLPTMHDLNTARGLASAQSVLFSRLCTVTTFAQISAEYICFNCFSTSLSIHNGILSRLVHLEIQILNKYC